MFFSWRRLLVAPAIGDFSHPYLLFHEKKNGRRVSRLQLARPSAPEPPTGASSVPLAMAEPAPDIDLFRAGPVRYLGYSNEAITARRPPNGRCREKRPPGSHGPVGGRGVPAASAPLVRERLLRPRRLLRRHRRGVARTGATGWAECCCRGRCPLEASTHIKDPSHRRAAVADRGEEDTTPPVLRLTIHLACRRQTLSCGRGSRRLLCRAQ